MSIKTLNVIRICPGKRHAWYNTNLGFPVRKQLGKNFDMAKAMAEVAKYVEAKPEVLKQGYAGKFDITTDPLPKRSNRKYFIWGLEGVALLVIAYIIFF